MPQSLTLLVVVVTVTIKTKVHLVGKGGLKRHLPSRHLKRKFIKTTKPKTTELYCSIAHSTHNAFLTEKKKSLPNSVVLGFGLGFQAVDSSAQGDNPFARGVVADCICTGQVCSAAGAGQ